jgi:hypothetical protein
MVSITEPGRTTGSSIAVVGETTGIASIGSVVGGWESDAQMSSGIS